MAFTPFETSTTNISTLSDRPNQNDGLSSAQLKGRFDKAGNDIKTYLNDVLLEELESVTDGDSGADNIGATAVGDGTATTVQGILEEIDADVTALDGTAVHLTGNEAIAGIKNFTDSIYVGSFTIQDNVNTGEIIGGTGEDKLSFSMGDLKFNGDLVWTAGNDGHASGLDADTLDGKQDADMVHKAGAETVTGVKTFAVSPIVPAPTTDTQASTKKYVDDADVLKVNITDIVNDLTTGGTAVPLSAEQGKTLQGEVGTLTSLSTTEKGSLVGAINELNTDKIETSAITNSLTETGTGKVLDARQGRTLSDFIGDQTYTEKNYIADGESATASINKLDMQLKDTADLVSTHTGATNPHGITKTTVGLDSVDNVKQATTTTYTTTLDTTWSGTEAPYTKEQTVTDILSTDNPIVDIVLSGTYATDSKIEADWAEIYRIVTSTNSVTLYAHKKPTNSIPLQFKVVR